MVQIGSGVALQTRKLKFTDLSKTLQWRVSMLLPYDLYTYLEQYPTFFFQTLTEHVSNLINVTDKMGYSNKCLFRVKFTEMYCG